MKQFLKTKKWRIESNLEMAARMIILVISLSLILFAFYWFFPDDLTAIGWMLLCIILVLALVLSIYKKTRAYRIKFNELVPEYRIQYDGFNKISIYVSLKEGWQEFYLYEIKSIKGVKNIKGNTKVTPYQYSSDKYDGVIISLLNRDPIMIEPVSITLEEMQELDKIIKA